MSVKFLQYFILIFLCIFMVDAEMFLPAVFSSTGTSKPVTKSKVKATFTERPSLGQLSNLKANPSVPIPKIGKANLSGRPSTPSKTSSITEAKPPAAIPQKPYSVTKSTASPRVDQTTAITSPKSTNKDTLRISSSKESTQPAVKLKGVAAKAGRNESPSPATEKDAAKKPEADEAEWDFFDFIKDVANETVPNFPPPPPTPPPLPEPPISLPLRWCGGAKYSMLPFQDRDALRIDNFTHQTVPEDQYISYKELTARVPKNAHVATGKFGCKPQGSTRILQENFGTGGLWKAFPKSELSPSKLQLIKCLNDIDQCTKEVVDAASQLTSIRMLSRQRPAKMGNLHKFKTCAVVGNSGHMLFKKYGQYINKHDVVVRFNTVKYQRKFAENIGTRTTIRVLNHIVSKMACCGKKGVSARNSTLLLWHPGGEAEIAEACRAAYPNTQVLSLKRHFIMGEVAVMLALRKDAMRLGLTGFGKWRQMTSGAHGVLLMLRMCQRVSLYGFTTYANNKFTKDQYTGRTKRSADGEWWHDFDGESMAWLLLHAAGKLSICSV